MPADGAQHSFIKCEAVKVAYRQTKEGMVVSFAIHPSDMPKELALAPVGTRVMLAVAEIATDGAGDAPAPPAPRESVASPKNADRADKARQAYRDDNEMGQAARLAGIFRKDVSYQQWLSSRFAPPGKLGNAEEIREWQHMDIGVDSCSEISTDPLAYERWKAHMLSFEQAVGRAAKPR